MLDSFLTVEQLSFRKKISERLRFLGAPAREFGFDFLDRHREDQREADEGRHVCLIAGWLRKEPQGYKVAYLIPSEFAVWA